MRNVLSALTPYFFPVLFPSEMIYSSGAWQNQGFGKTFIISVPRNHKEQAEKCRQTIMQLNDSRFIPCHESLKTINASTESYLTMGICMDKIGMASS